MNLELLYKVEREREAESCGKWRLGQIVLHVTGKGGRQMLVVCDAG